MKRSDAGRAGAEVNGHDNRAKRRVRVVAVHPKATVDRGVTRPVARFEVNLSVVL